MNNPFKSLANFSHNHANSLAKLGVSIALVLLLASCGNLRLGQSRFNSSTSVSNQSTQASPPTQVAQTALNNFISGINLDLDQLWGANNIKFGPQQLVRYSDHYLTRSVINFETGIIKFQTLDHSNFINALENEIIYTLLMREQPIDTTTLYDNKVPTGPGQPLLYGQVVDNNHHNISSLVQAATYARYLLTNNLQFTRLANGRIEYYVQLGMIPGHLNARAKIYRDMIYRYSNLNRVDPSLTFAICEVESQFNPYARSSAGALGIMQIVPSTAGQAAFKYLGYSGRPSRSELFDPKYNIQIGTVYLHYLEATFFSTVNNPVKRRLLMIASYNGGPGATLRSFNSNQTIAIQMINNMSVSQLYNYLTSYHFSGQTRRYVQKVVEAYKHYSKF